MNEAEICLRRGQYYMDPDIGRTYNQFALLGRAWHIGMEAYYGARKDDPGLMLNMSGEQIEWRMQAIVLGYIADTWEHDPDFAFSENASTLRSIDEVSNAAIQMTESWALQRKTGMEWESDYRILATEAHITLSMDWHLFRGVIDLVMDHPEMGVVITDHKTGARMWNKTKMDARRLTQAPLYAEAWYRTTGQDPTWATYDLMLHSGQFVRVWVPVAQEVRAYTVGRWHDLADLYAQYRSEGTDLPMNPTSPLCQAKYCNYWDICPSGAALDRLTIDTYPDHEPELPTGVSFE
jgi:RecB family exonuclease